MKEKKKQREHEREKEEIINQYEKKGRKDRDRDRDRWDMYDRGKKKTRKIYEGVGERKEREKGLIYNKREAEEDMKKIKR